MKSLPRLEATPTWLLARAVIAALLIAAAVAGLAVASLIEGHGRAAAQSPGVAEASPPAARAPLSVPPTAGDAGSFAFGFLVFDWDPAAPGGVPGFDSWPPASRP